MVNAGQPLGRRFAEKPALNTGLEIYYEAFNALSTCRQIGMGIGPIPWTAVRQYAEDLGMEGISRDRLFTLVSEMDSVYIEHVTKDMKKK